MKILEHITGRIEAPPSDRAGFKSRFLTPLSIRAFVKGSVRIQVGKRPLGSWDKGFIIGVRPYTLWEEEGWDRGVGESDG